jgi:hypothetical protein
MALSNGSTLQNGSSQGHKGDFDNGSKNKNGITHVNGSDHELKANGSNGVIGVYGNASHNFANGFTDSDNGVTQATVKAASQPTTRPRAFVFSTFDEDGATRISAAYQAFLSSRESSLTAEHGDEEGRFLEDLAYTLATHRTAFTWRFTVIADSISGLANKLAMRSSPTRMRTDPKLGLVFTGQGAQWYAMGRELLTADLVFNTSMFTADQYLRRLGCSWSLIGMYDT